MSKGPIILWFRCDLRLADHPALDAATKTGAPIIPAYILDDETVGVWRSGGASRWWLAQSRTAPDAARRDKGARLILRRGGSVAALAALADETKAEAVYLTRGYEPFAGPQETALQARLKNTGVDCRRF